MRENNTLYTYECTLLETTICSLKMYTFHYFKHQSSNTYSLPNSLAKNRQPGKKRYIFDLQCKVIFKIKDSTTDKVIASGSLKLPDLCSTHHDELEVDIEGWKKKPSDDNQQLANDCRLRIVSEVRESIKLWVQDFNNQY